MKLTLKYEDDEDERVIEIVKHYNPHEVCSTDLLQEMLNLLRAAGHASGNSSLVIRHNKDNGDLFVEHETEL